MCMLRQSLHLSSAKFGRLTPSIACVYLSFEDVVDLLRPVVLQLLSTATDCYHARFRRIYEIIIYHYYNIIYSWFKI